MSRSVSYLVWGVLSLGWAVPAAAAEEWTTDAHSSASVAMKDDLITIECPNNCHAHLERRLDVKEPFRVRAAVRAPESGQLAPSLFLYWSPENWLRVGHISAHDTYHVHGPGIYGVASEGGAQTLYRLTTTSSKDWRYNPDHGGLDKLPVESRWNHMAIVLTAEKIYFQVSEEGTKWETIQIAPRSSQLSGPPERLIVGKGYYEPGNLTAPDLDNDLPTPGGVVKAEIKDLVVEPVSAEIIAQAAQPESLYRDVEGEQELSKPGDPTFESVATHWPPLLYERDAIGVADHPDEIAVFPNGVLGFYPNTLIHPKAEPGQRAWIAVGSDKARFGGETTVSRRLMDNWLPVLTCGWTHGGFQYEQTLAGWSRGMSEDEPLIGLLELKAINKTGQTGSTRLAFFSEREKKELAAWENLQVPAGGEATVYLEVPFPARGENLTVRKIEKPRFETLVSQVRDSWITKVSDGMQISVPELRVMNAWRAWLVWLLINVDKINGHYEYHDGGGGFYELVFGFSATKGAQLADQMNRRTEARRWIEAMLNMGDAEGLHVMNFGIPDQGALLSAVAHHYDYTQDKEWLRKVSPTLVKMCQWGKKARAQAKTEQPTTSPVYGMIKGRPYCDHPDPGYYVISDIYLANGMKETARLLKEIGMEQDSAWIAAEASDYIADTKRVVEKSVFMVDDQELLPLFPETRELLRATGWFASDYYSLCAVSLLDCGGEIIPPDSKYAKMITDALERRGGLLMGVSRFWGGIDHAYTGSYWIHRLAAGEPEKALLGLYASLAYGMSRDTFSSVEVTFCKDGKNFPTLPHNYSNFEQLRLVKNLLVMEEGDRLVLGAGIARPWLKDGLFVEARNAGTKHGDVSYRIDSREADNRLVANLELPERPYPGGVKVVFRHPAEQQLKDVQVTGEGVEVAERGAEHVLLKGAHGAVRVEAVY